MVKCDVLFEVRAEFLNVISTGFGFKGISVLFTKLSHMVVWTGYVIPYKIQASEKCVNNTFLLNLPTLIKMIQGYRYFYNM
jgi:hypothetical protein